jgi:hypothetical protein
MQEEIQETQNQIHKVASVNQEAWNGRFEIPYVWLRKEGFQKLLM